MGGEEPAPRAYLPLGTRHLGQYSLMGPRVADESRKVIRAPKRVRAMAVWMLTMVVIGSALFVGNAIASGEWGLLLVLVFWSLPLGYYASRLMRLSAVADGDGVIVHNRYRSRTLRWSDIEAISYEKRRGPWWYPLVMIWDRWVGVIRLRDGSDMEGWSPAQGTACTRFATSTPRS